jgi:3-hydroxybutyryl-CoA dehydratase
MSTDIKLSELRVGTVIAENYKAVFQEDINLYAQASRDFNPIHIDAEFAKKTSSGGTIAHGMLILAYVSQMMTDSFGINWLTKGKLNVRFKTPARPGDTIKVEGKISKLQIETDQNSITCEFRCSNQKGEIIITGDASVKVKDDQRILLK